MKLTSKNFLAIAPLIIIIVAVIFGLFGLSAVFAASRAGEVNLISPRVDVAATAQSIRFENRKAQLEAASQQRIATLEAQIEQSRQSLDGLQRTIQTQTAEQQAQLANLEQQVAQKQRLVETLHASVIKLNQEIIAAEGDYQAKMTALQTETSQTEAELEAELEAVNRQLATAESALEEFDDDDNLPQLRSLDADGERENDSAHKEHSDSGDADDDDDRDDNGSDHDSDEHEDEGDEDEGDEDEDEKDEDDD